MSMLMWVVLVAAAIFIVQRGIARHYERLLRELEDIERDSAVERFMAAHVQSKNN